MKNAIQRFLQYLQVERNASDLTIKSYREDLDALAEYLEESCGNCPTPGEITTLDLRGYIAAVQEAGYAKATIARRLASLRSFFRFGRREGWGEVNPAKALRNPRRGRSLPHFLSTDEIGRLLDAPPRNQPQGKRDAAILETMYSAGLRVSEVVGLREGDLDFDGGVVRVRGKGRRERLAPIGSYATRAIHDWLTVRQLAEDQPDGPQAPVFLNKFGRTITTRSVGRMLEKYLKLTGLDRRTARIRCGTALPRTCSTEARIFAACRNCSAIRAS